MILKLTYILTFLCHFNHAEWPENPSPGDLDILVPIPDPLPTTPFPMPPQDIHTCQRLFGQQHQEDDQPPPEVYQRHRVRVKLQGLLEWRADMAGHFYRQVYDDSAHEWYVQWWSYDQGRAYRVLADINGRKYTAWI